MSSQRQLPHLEIVRVDQLVLHEFHDEQRTPALVQKLQSSGILKNPPIVMPFKHDENRYMVLDGANRVSSFRHAKIDNMVVQVIPGDDPHLDLTAWNHVLWGRSPDQVFSLVRKIPGITLQPSTLAQSFYDLRDLHSLAVLQLPNEKIFSVFCDTINLYERIKIINTLVNNYIARLKIDRTTGFEVGDLMKRYPDLSGLIRLPTFTVSDVMDVVDSGDRMPPGSTRFTISPRVLHLNFPLEKLISPQSLAAKNLALQAWIQQKTAKKAVRYYAEATYLFDE